LPLRQYLQNKARPSLQHKWPWNEEFFRPWQRQIPSNTLLVIVIEAKHPHEVVFEGHFCNDYTEVQV